MRILRIILSPTDPYNDLAADSITRAAQSC